MATTTAEKIEVMQAFVQGKKIEFKGHSEDKWSATPNPAWSWDIGTYRVKQEPKEFVIAYREDTGQIVGGLPAGQAKVISVSADDVKVGQIKTMLVREVL